VKVFLYAIVLNKKWRGLARLPWSLARSFSDLPALDVQSREPTIKGL
jgi:hypothetical protein